MLEPAEVPHMPQDLLDEEKKLLLLQFQEFLISVQKEVVYYRC
jgi:hypothetical protein